MRRGRRRARRPRTQRSADAAGSTPGWTAGETPAYPATCGGAGLDGG
ncbi:MAG: hypothetical protein FWH01_16640 [Oscillospiraceae bacterium]|nr:hypothetical protein [Oscillospiraceae bacterium]